MVIVGERKDSQTYVRMKRKACEEVGIASFGADLPATATQQEVLDVVQQLNANPDVHGILVQLPVRVEQGGGGSLTAARAVVCGSLQGRLTADQLVCSLYIHGAARDAANKTAE